MSGSNGPPRRFRIGRTPAVLAQVQACYQRASEAGRAAEFVTALRYLLANLRTHPREFGEPAWTLPNARLVVRVSAHGPVWVRYAVHESEFEVVLLHVEFMTPTE